MENKVLVFIPVYNCEKQIKRVIKKFTKEIQSKIHTIMIIDNISNDSTYINAKKEGQKIIKNCNFLILQNHENYGLGGSHKAAFNYAISNEFDYLIVCHGDDQCEINDIISHLDDFVSSNFDCFLGSRFMSESKLLGYSFLKIIGNLFFNLLYSIFLKKKLSDLGSGLNMYKVNILNDREYHKFPDGLTFNYIMLIYSILKKHRIKFFPIFWKEEDQISNVKLFNHGISMLKLLISYIFSKNFITKEFRSIKFKNYSSKIMFKNFNK